MSQPESTLRLLLVEDDEDDYLITRDLLRAAIGLDVDRDVLRKRLAGWLGAAPTGIDLAAWIPRSGPKSSGTRKPRRNRRRGKRIR